MTTKTQLKNRLLSGAAALALVGAHERQHLPRRALLGLEGQPQVGPVEAAHEHARWLGEQLVEAEDLLERDRAMRVLLTEESRLAMLVGVTVGFELARELADLSDSPEPAGG